MKEPSSCDCAQTSKKITSRMRKSQARIGAIRHRIARPVGPAGVPPAGVPAGIAVSGAAMKDALMTPSASRRLEATAGLSARDRDQELLYRNLLMFGSSMLALVMTEKPVPIEAGTGLPVTWA